jgi:hypothetical protein
LQLSKHLKLYRRRRALLLPHAAVVQWHVYAARHHCRRTTFALGHLGHIEQGKWSQKSSYETEKCVHTIEV